jgi:hypothetical protein
MIIANFIVTYFTEKFGVWYLSVWWKNRQDRKRMREREAEIAEEERLNRAQEVPMKSAGTPGNIKNSKGGV